MKEWREECLESEVMMMRINAKSEEQAIESAGEDPTLDSSVIKIVSFHPIISFY
jgi:hypothetical protein